MDFDYSGVLNKCDRKKIVKDANKLPFGRFFTDHMFVMDYEDGKWGKGAIMKYEDFDMKPAALVFHYGQEIFEGLKAFKNTDGKISIFRPEKNVERFNKSCRRLVMPEVPEDVFMEALKHLCEIDQDLIPAQRGCAMYLRPTLIATQEKLGLTASSCYRFFIIACTVGSYFAGGFKPVKIWVEQNLVRAFDGGVGDVKAGANYAASLLAGEIAKEHGCSQVLWLDANERKYVEEVGAMNLFFVIDGVLTTAPLGGTILGGITRLSVMDIASKIMGMKVEERRISLEEVTQGIESGKVSEVFGSGTAAAIAPVSDLVVGDKMYTLGEGKVGPTALKVFETIQGIQFNEIDDKFGWNTHCDEKFNPKPEDKSSRPEGEPELPGPPIMHKIDTARAHVLEEETCPGSEPLKFKQGDTKIDLDLLPEDKRGGCEDISKIAFGTTYSDHMMTLEFSGGKWGTPKIHPYGTFKIAPSAMVFHYCPEFFEGMKAFRRPSGEVALFRADRNIARFNKSARRLCMPEVDPVVFMDSLTKLISIDSKWVPSVQDSALYIRPFMIGTEGVLGVRPSTEYKFMIICSPVGPYFGPLVKPVSIYVASDYSRAAAGGVGNVKAGGNYAISLLAGEHAKKKGFSQVLWLDSKQHEYVEEVGAMNMFFVKSGTIYTAPLGGTILPGITRESLKIICLQKNIPFEEKALSINEITKGIHEGTVTEAFGCGTAASVTPVGSVSYKDELHKIGDGETVGPICSMLLDTLRGIQRGTHEDTLGWNLVLS